MYGHLRALHVLNHSFPPRRSSDLNRRYNVAALLGLRGVEIKSHGSADVYAYGFALQRAREAVVSKLQERTAQAVALITQRVQLGEAAAGEPEAAGDTG